MRRNLFSGIQIQYKIFLLSAGQEIEIFDAERFLFHVIGNDFSLLIYGLMP